MEEELSKTVGSFSVSGDGRCFKSGDSGESSGGGGLTAVRWS